LTPSAYYLTRLSQPEHKQNRRLLLVAQFRRVDEPLLGGPARSRRDGNILLAVGLKSHRRRRETRADVYLPKLCARGVVIGSDRAVEHGGEAQPACRNQSA